MTTPSSPDSAARGSASLPASSLPDRRDLAPRFPVLAVAVERDRAADWQEWPAALFVVLDPKLLIEQPPPDHDSLAGEFGINLVGHARDRQAAVDAD